MGTSDHSRTFLMTSIPSKSVRRFSIRCRILSGSETLRRTCSVSVFC